jgi:ribosomal protein S18 acetylase RimI-like enzyme
MGFVITVPDVSQPARQLPIRPFDVRTDMMAVSDLVEICFAERLSPDGRALLQKMRSSARSKHFQRWAYSMAGRISMPFTGFVWVEGEEIIGNLSLIPYHLARRNYYMIANVAVHPDYQRRGIGRSLLRRSLRFLKSKDLDGIWLQVEDSNQGAVDLYHSEGFQERSRRTTWILDPDQEQAAWSSPAEGNLRILYRQPGHWKDQRRWLENSYPPEVRWHLPLKLSYLRGGLWGALTHLFLAVPSVQHWSVVDEHRLKGVFTWQKSKTHADWLWIAAPPEGEGDLLDAFVPHWLRYEESRRPLRVNYPHGQANQSLLVRGFKPTRTLIWMEYQGSVGS